jgi:mono/diheme cytochrome c family protein
MRKKILLHIFFLSVALSPIFTLAQVDYESEIQPIFSSNCIACHGGQNGVTLSSYDAVMSSVGQQYQTEVVVPNNPDNSPLVDKISNSNPEFGQRMPLGGPYLSSQEINLIRQWISEGANEMATSNEVITELPDGFKLKGNYPNPFNPTTVISFEVPEPVKYQIKLYTTHGVLLKEFLGFTSSGNTSVQIDFSGQSSGVYFYQISVTSGNRKYLLGSKKMTLVK